VSKINVGDIVYVKPKGKGLEFHHHARVVQYRPGDVMLGVKGLRYYGFDTNTTWVSVSEVEVMTDERKSSPHYEAWRLAHKAEEEAAELARAAITRVWNHTPEADQLTLTRADYLRAASNALLQAAQPDNQ